MSDYTITDASVDGNVTTPSDIPLAGAVDLTLTLTTTGTIVYPITVSAQITIKTDTNIDFPSVIGPEVLASAPIELTIPVATTAITQVGNKVSQNYLVTIVDTDDRSQTINIATPDSFPEESPNNPAGYPSVIAVEG